MFDFPDTNTTSLTHTRFRCIITICKPKRLFGSGLRNWRMTMFRKRQQLRQPRPRQQQQQLCRRRAQLRCRQPIARRRRQRKHLSQHQQQQSSRRSHRRHRTRRTTTTTTTTCRHRRRALITVPSDRCRRRLYVRAALACRVAWIARSTCSPISLSWRRMRMNHSPLEHRHQVTLNRAYWR